VENLRWILVQPYDASWELDRARDYTAWKVDSAWRGVGLGEELEKKICADGERNRRDLLREDGK